MSDVAIEALIEALSLETTLAILCHKAEVQQAAAEAAVGQGDYARATTIWQRQSQVLDSMRVLSQDFAYIG